MRGAHASAAMRIAILFMTILTGCQLKVGTHGPQASGGDTPGTTSESAEPRSKLPWDPTWYANCVTQFDANYDAWLPRDRDAKAVIAATKGKSPYVAVPALLEAYHKLDNAAAVRQTGNTPAGAIYATSTRLELALALVEIGATTHAKSCVNDQHSLDVENGSQLNYELMPPLTGDREQDKIRMCGGPSAANRDAWLAARVAAVQAFNTNNRSIHTYQGTAWLSGKIRSISATAKETTLVIGLQGDTRKCVRNGRIKQAADGSWGEDCNFVYGPTYETGRKTIHLAAAQQPFKVASGDDIVLNYELDPDAPAGDEKVPRQGGWWWYTNVSRGKATVFDNCTVKGAREAEVFSIYSELSVR
jgi:hypothetical protein